MSFLIDTPDLKLHNPSLWGVGCWPIIASGCVFNSGKMTEMCRQSDTLYESERFGLQTSVF